MIYAANLLLWNGPYLWLVYVLLFHLVPLCSNMYESGQVPKARRGSLPGSDVLFYYFGGGVGGMMGTVRTLCPMYRGALR